jgi:hypothetical protein
MYLRYHPPTIHNVNDGLSMPKDDSTWISNIIIHDRRRNTCSGGSHRGSEGCRDIPVKFNIVVNVCPD